MAYDVADIEEYSWGQDATFGATTVAHRIVGPRGKVGLVRDLSVDVTTALVGTTTVPEIDVGISSGDSTFGRYRLGTTAILGYAVGFHRASTENITGNPPRTLADYVGHIILDGGPLTSQVLAGGSSTTVMPAGRIPASPFTIQGAAIVTTNVRFTVKELIPPQLLVGQTVNLRGVLNTAGGQFMALGETTVSAIDTTTPGNPQWFEVGISATTGTFAGGGQADVVVFVTEKAGTGGSPAGGGHVRVKIEWVGPQSP